MWSTVWFVPCSSSAGNFFSWEHTIMIFWHGTLPSCFRRAHIPMPKIRFMRKWFSHFEVEGCIEPYPWGWDAKKKKKTEWRSCYRTRLIPRFYRHATDFSYDWLTELFSRLNKFKLIFLFLWYLKWGSAMSHYVFNKTVPCNLFSSWH